MNDMGGTGAYDYWTIYFNNISVEKLMDSGATISRDVSDTERRPIRFYGWSDGCGIVLSDTLGGTVTMFIPMGIGATSLRQDIELTEMVRRRRDILWSYVRMMTL